MPPSLAQMQSAVPPEQARAVWDQLNAVQGAMFLAADGFRNGAPKTKAYRDIIKHMDALNPSGGGYWGQREPGKVLALHPQSGQYMDPGPVPPGTTDKYGHPIGPDGQSLAAMGR